MVDDSDIPDDLTDAQLQQLRQDLLALRDSLTELIETSKEGTKPVTLDQSSVGRVSRIDAIQVQQMAVANRRQHELRLRQVAQAISAIERDEYGYCRRCEEPIGYRRLEARPESAFCVRCQGATEKR